MRGILPDEQIGATLRQLQAELARDQARVQGGGAIVQGDESIAVGEGAWVSEGLCAMRLSTPAFCSKSISPTGRPRLSLDF